MVTLKNVENVQYCKAERQVGTIPDLDCLHKKLMLGQQSSHVGEKITQTSNSWILYWIIHWTRPQEILPKRPEKDLQSFIAPESVEKKNHNVSIKKKKKVAAFIKKCTGIKWLSI